MTDKGMMAPELLYESPFVDIASNGPEQIFELAKARQLVSVIEGINRSAVV